MQLKRHEAFSRFKIRRNPDYRASVRLALRYGVWWAPTTLLYAVGLPLAGVFEAIGAMVMRGLAWIGLTCAILALGVAGMLMPSDDNQS